MTTIDLHFPLQPADVALDHGYALYAALSHALPSLHSAKWLGVHPLSGRRTGRDTIHVEARSGLRLRMPAEQIPIALPLTGRTLDVAGARLVLGAPTVHALVPAAALDARLVVVKLTEVPTTTGENGAAKLDRVAMEPRVLAELGRQLEKLGVRGAIELRGVRRIEVAKKRIVGFTVRVSGLDADGSLRVQETGLGGKRRMGCGVFRPTRGK